MNGREQIEYERARQISDEGWSEAHDDSHGEGVLASAATHYLVHAMTGDRPRSPRWPWTAEHWKPKTQVRDLVRAGALFLAEAEVNDRMADRSESGDGTTFGPALSHRGRAIVSRMIAAGVAQEIDRLEAP